MTDFLERISKLSPKRLALLATELNSSLQRAKEQTSEPLAIIGMGCRFPGGANNPESFWQLIADGRDAIGEVPKDRWNIDEFYDPNPETPGKMSTRWGGFLTGVDQFDPEFFGISPREAAALDPQQRVLLEVAWEALEHAGQSPEHLSGSHTGVFAGLCNNDYFFAGIEDGVSSIDAYLATGSAHSVAAGRISYLLGLIGPSLAVDTSCSSSLVAVHLACQSLRLGECRMALAGGVNVVLKPDVTIALSKSHMMSPDGRCKPFDASANGFVRADGCGLIVLKRLSDARADGDRILAVIRGTASNQDGKSSGLTAPSGPSQVALIQGALANAGLIPEEVDFIEAHGTGTSLGDPIEARALADIFGAGRPSDCSLYVGSVKSNIGHAESAAGVAGLIKAVMALQHGRIPPSLHFKDLNPNIDWAGLPIHVPTATTTWNRPEGARVAGISSFGFSGTNAHVIVSDLPTEDPVTTHSERDTNAPSLHVLPLSARTEQALADLSGEYDEAFTNDPVLNFADVCYTAGTGRSHFEQRLAVVSSTIAESKEALAAFQRDKKHPRIRSGRSVPGNLPGVAFMFTGQGSQYPGMGRDLFETQPVFRREMEQCAGILAPLLEKPLLEVIFADSGESGPSLLGETQYTQPALFALEYSLAALWRSWGIEPAAVLGHSVGEYVAACVAGVFSLEEALRLISVRARLMQALPRNGAMAAVLASEDRLREAIAPFAESVSVAATNGPRNTVLSGEAEHVHSIVERLQREGLEAKFLQVSHAFHSPLIEPALPEFEQFARTIQQHAPTMDLVLNVTGQLLDGSSPLDAAYWRRHARGTVRFAESIATLRSRGMRVFLEVGPAPVLSGMARQCVNDPGVKFLSSMRKEQSDSEQMLSSLASLYTLGINPDWNAIDRRPVRHRISLPTYPFQRQRHWIDTRRAKSQHNVQHPLAGNGMRSARGEWVFESKLSLEALPYLDDHRVHGIAIFPASGYLEMAAECGRRAFLGEEFAVSDFVIQDALVLPESGELAAQLIANPGADGSLAFEIFSYDDQISGAQPVWTLHAKGCISPVGAAASTIHVPFEEVRKRCSEELSGADYYQELTSMGIAFGPSFQTIRSIWRRDGEALGQLQVPELLASGYHVHPALLDGCFHLLDSTVSDAGQQANTHSFGVVGLDRMVITHPPTAGSFWTYGILRIPDQNNRDALTGDLLLAGENGEVFGRIDGVRLKRVSRDTLLRSSPTRFDDWFYEVRWLPKKELECSRQEQSIDYIPVSAELQSTALQSTARTDLPGLPTVVVAKNSAVSAPPSAGVWLLVAENEQLAELWRFALEARGQRVRFAKAAEKSRDVEAISQAYGSILRESIGGHAPLLGVVHLAGTGIRAHSDEMSASSLEAAVQTGCVSALSMVQALVRENNPECGRLWLITRAGLSTAESALDVSQSPMWGLGRTVAVEHPEFWGGLLDVADMNIESIEVAVDQMLSSSREDQLAIVGKDVLVGRLMRCARPTEVMQDRQAFRPDVSYLVTGGFGGMGRLVLNWMADQGARHIAVIGRSVDPAKPEETVVALGARGVEVLPMRADVSDDSALKRVFEQIGAKLPKLAGVIHIAGIFDDRVLARQDWPRFERVLKPKVTGSWNLHQRTKNMPLDLFVLFSSGASFLAPVGLGNYAAGNAFLDALACHRRALGLPAVSIDWGPWEKVGMAEAVGDRRESQWTQVGCSTMTSQQGLAAFRQLIQDAPPQVGVLVFDWQKYFEHFGSATLPLYEELRRSIQRISHDRARRSAAPQGIRDFENAPAADRVRLLFEHICNEAAKVLGISRGDQIDADRGLFDLGMDSLTAIELKNRLQATIGKRLSSTLFFDYPNVQKLTEYLVRDVLQWSDDSQVSDAPQERVHSSTGQDDFSEDELAELLAQKLQQLQ